VTLLLSCLLVFLSAAVAPLLMVEARSVDLHAAMSPAREGRFGRHRGTRGGLADDLGGLICSPSTEDGRPGGNSFWLRNSCLQGYVTVQGRKTVLAQHEGLGRHSKEGEEGEGVVKELDGRAEGGGKARLLSHITR